MVDVKAPLAPTVAAMPGVTLRQGSAFGLAPEPVDWLFSDIIAYPDRLLALVTAWIEAGTTGRIVCTIKLQGGRIMMRWRGLWRFRGHG